MQTSGAKKNGKPRVFFFFSFFYSCCSQLKHRASVKRFVSLDFLNVFQSVALSRRGISPSQNRYLQTQNKRKHTSMPRGGFEPTIPVFERAKTFNALDHAATLIGQTKCNLDLQVHWNWWENEVCLWKLEKTAKAGKLGLGSLQGVKEILKNKNKNEIERPKFLWNRDVDFMTCGCFSL
jgi:hypothetical protein